MIRMSRDSLYVKKRRPADILLKTAVWMSAAVTLSLLAFLLTHVLARGLPYVTWDFLTGTYSELDGQSKGILPMIINTVYVIVITLALSLPVGIAAAVYLTQYARCGRLVRIIRFAAETLAGIPSVLYGIFGYSVFCVGLKMGFSIIAGCLTMTMCILPTIIRSTEEALLSVPDAYRDGALALGAGKLRTVLGTVLPCALPGIVTAVILAVGRIIGETAALWYTVGASGYGMPDGVISHIGKQGRTLSLHLYQSASLGRDPEYVAYATASVLLILVFILNRLASLAARLMSRRRR